MNAQQILDACFHNDMSTEPCAECFRKANAAEDRLEALLDAERAGERAPEILVFEQRDLRGVSPWVARNLDCAQYAQPRGSQYEG